MAITGNPPPMEAPVPPTSPNIEEMHRWMLSLYNWIKQTSLAGNQMTHFGTAQLNQIPTSQEATAQVGKIFYDVNVDAYKGAVLVDNAVVIKTFTIT